MACSVAINWVHHRFSGISICLLTIINSYVNAWLTSNSKTIRESVKRKCNVELVTIGFLFALVFRDVLSGGRFLFYFWFFGRLISSKICCDLLTQCDVLSENLSEFLVETIQFEGWELFLEEIQRSLFCFHFRKFLTRGLLCAVVNCTFGISYRHSCGMKRKRVQTEAKVF